MSLAETVITAMLIALPGPTPAHAETIAAAVNSATLAATCQQDWQHEPACRPVWTGKRTELAAGLLVLGHFESAYLERIQLNECRIKIGECDMGRSRSYWQAQIRWVPDPTWWTGMVGTDYMAVTRSAYVASRALGAGYRKCRTRVGAVAAYAVGGCVWPGAAGRVRWWDRLLLARL